MRTFASFVAAAAVLFVPMLAAGEHQEGSAEPQPRAWDQARVAELAGKLAKNSEELRNAVRQQAVGETIGSGQSRATEKVMDQLRGLRTDCNRLQKDVEGGKGRDDTLQAFKRIDERRRKVAEELRRMFLTQENLDRVKEGRSLLEELRLYYTGEVDPRPDLVGPKKE